MGTRVRHRVWDEVAGVRVDWAGSVVLDAVKFPEETGPRAGRQADEKVWRRPWRDASLVVGETWIWVLGPVRDRLRAPVWSQVYEHLGNPLDNALDDALQSSQSNRNERKQRDHSA